MKQSAGLLMYRLRNDNVEIFLVHPGGPFFKNKDEGVWSIPKGEPFGDEPLLEAAKREFMEETGIRPEGPFTSLGSVKQKGGKIVHAWAFMKDDSNWVNSNYFELEWPPKSGKKVSFPEVDKGGYLALKEAEIKIISAQREFLSILTNYLSIS
jgi:predicted NUDIX family NTP pyrophosphohydrolase